jgi:hypothetical protein
MVGEIGRVKADLPKYLWHLTHQIKCFSVGFSEVNPQTVQRHHRILGFASLTNSIFS